MFKVVFCVLASFVVTTSVCSATDLDAVDHYSFDPVTMSALDYAVMPLAATSWDTADQTALASIRNAFYNPNSGYVSNSIIGWVKKLADNSVSLTDLVSDVASIESGLVGNSSDSVKNVAGNILTALTGTPNVTTGSLLDNIRSVTVLPDMETDLQQVMFNTNLIDTTTKSILSTVNNLYTFVSRSQSISIGRLNSLGNFVLERNIQASYPFFVALDSVNSSFDTVLQITGDRTLYSRIKQLQEVLASDDDLALAESQKANREEIEDSFLSGSSGSTSLGVSDFAGLADVGGSVNDSLSLDGNATLSSFTSGLSAADSAGQGWFSEETRSQLDAVSSTATYSLRDPDPYNMSGWEDRYYWLLGDDE